MKLITDYGTPYELSVAARVGAADREREQNKLSDVLPVENVTGTTITLESNSEGRVEVAEYRAFDAETTFGNADAKGRRQIVELAPLGQQARVSEYDQLTQRNVATPENVKAAIGRKSIHLGRAVADRLEAARGEVLQTGKITINENGFYAEMDFGRDPSMTATAATSWANPSTDWISELNEWMDAYYDLNGELPGRIIAGRKAINAMKSADIFGKVVNDPNSVVSRRVTTEDVQNFLSDEGLPTIQAYGRKVVRGGQSVDVLDPNAIIFVPDTSLNAGSTAMGTTLEAYSPDYGIVPGEEAGIVVGGYQSHNPMGLYLNASALGLPVLHDANRFMAATIIV